MDAKDFTLTQEELRQYFDYKNGNLYWKQRLAKCVHIGDKAGTLNPNGYVYIRFKNNIYVAHRLIYIWHYGKINGILDHIDGNRSNNFINNLRIANYTSNQYNRKISKNNSSGVKGVYWNKRYNKWEASIKINKKPTYIGRYNNINEAKTAIEIFRQKNHKEFARHQ